LWEAIVTLSMFPVLVLFAWLQDVHYFDGKCPCCKKTDGEQLSEEQNSRVKVARVTPMDEKEIVKSLLESGKPVNEETIAAELQFRQQKEKKSYMMYRVNAIRGISGKKRVLHMEPEPEASSTELGQLKPVSSEPPKEFKPPSTATSFEFNTLEYAVREDAGTLSVAVLRNGNRDSVHTIQYETVDGTACAGEDYMPAQGTLVFNKGDHKKIVEVQIIQDDEIEQDEYFYVALKNPKGNSVSIGNGAICSVKILDVSHPGKVGFKHGHKNVQESAENVKLKVVRREGSQGNFFVSYKTQDGTAIAGIDYVEKSGTLKFGPCETVMCIYVDIIDNGEVEARPRSFECWLSTPNNENNTAELLEDKHKIRIDISDDESYSKMYNGFVKMWRKQKQHFSLSTGTWKEQFEDAVEPPKDPSYLDFFLHSIAFPWKLIFAFIPPTDYLNGWLTFGCSLAATGVVTMFIGEVASTWGCMIGMSKAMVAITIVALGTSMPDTFASRTATIMAPDADAAIGNVTGSNSVNVFLGLGLPWVISAVYSSVSDDVEYYVVPQGTLAFAVAVFTPCALVALGFLLIRRAFVGGELGGEPCSRYSTTLLFVLLWVFFIFMAGLKDYGHL